MADRDLSVGLNDFSISLDRMLAEVGDNIDYRMEPAVRKACRTGSRACKKHATELGLKDHGGKTVWANYLAGFASTVRTGKNYVAGEIGQKNVPGLVHLIELGHAKVVGGRTRAFPHVADAAEDTFKVLEEEINKAVDESL